MVAPAPPRPTPPRRAWAFYALLAVILLALPAGYFLFLARSEALPPPPPQRVEALESEPEKKMEVRIAGMDGNVEVRHLDGTWGPAQIGDALIGTNAVRTLDGAQAVLAGCEARVRGALGGERCGGQDFGRHLRHQQQRRGDGGGGHARRRSRALRQRQGGDRPERAAVDRPSRAGAHRTHRGALQPAAQGEVAGEGAAHLEQQAG